MKSRLLFLLSFIAISMNAQTTHNLDWFAGIGSNVDLTIQTGDTVIWTWTSPNHTVENVPGNSVENFNSGFLGPIGSTFSYTFTVVGDNDYFCGIHGAGSMSGTITVEDNLSIDDHDIDSFKLIFNTSEQLLVIQLNQQLVSGTITIIDMAGRTTMAQKLNNQDSASIDVSALANGNYIINIESNTIKQSKQFLKF